MLAKFLASLKFNDPGRLNAAVFVRLKISTRNSKLFSLLMVFFASGTTLASARSYQNLAKASNSVAAEASSLRKSPTINTASDANRVALYKVLGAYDVALGKALPLPTYSYKLQQGTLDAAWKTVAKRDEEEAVRATATAAAAPVGP